MAVFVSFSDESSGKNERDTFVFAGWLGPEKDWSEFFVPAWDHWVLAGPPRIPYLHVTEIRSPQFRTRHGLSEGGANTRLDNACVVLDQLALLQPLRVVVNGGIFRDGFKEFRIVPPKRKQFASTSFEPDYVCFLAYVWAVLNYVAQNHPEVEKVDFVVEHKNTVTRYIQEFHAGLAEVLTAFGNPELSPLVGQLVPGDRESSIPLQAADLLAWHCARREKLETMTKMDAARYRKIAYRKGARIELTKEMVSKMKMAFDS